MMPPDAQGARGALRRLWRQRPHVMVMGALSAAWLPGMPVYLAATFYRFALAEPWHFLVDYSWFHEAALRFFSEPLTLYADPEYFYPPPAVLTFWPTTWTSGVAGYIASGPLIFAGLTLAFVWALRLWEREMGETLDRATRMALLVIGLASAPTFQNLRYAQVNVLVLLSALAFLHLCQRQRPGWGALALAAGFWLKVLPLALLPLGLGRLRDGDWRRWRRFAAGAAAGWIALPLALLPWVPWELYREYALERFPAFSGMTDPGALSTSIQATLTRLSLPVEIVTASGMMPSSPEATLSAGAVGALVVGITALLVWTGRIGIVRAGFVVLAILPAVVPLGWEHTFVLAVPLLLVALAEASRQRGHTAGPLAMWLAGICALAFFAQRPPPPMLVSAVEVVPRGFIDLYLARLWMAVLVLVGLSLWRRTLAPPSIAAP